MDNPTIGQLRWRVKLYQEVQTASVFGTGIDYTTANERIVYADIQPVGTAVYLQGTQVDIDAITHRIFIRYADDLDEFQLIVRERTRPDQSTVTETYRVHRQSEINGRQRFLCLDCELRTDA